MKRAAGTARFVIPSNLPAKGTGELVKIHADSVSVSARLWKAGEHSTDLFLFRSEWADKYVHPSVSLRSALSAAQTNSNS
jgi:hypothetical protein